MKQISYIPFFVLLLGCILYSPCLHSENYHHDKYITYLLNEDSTASVIECKKLQDVVIPESIIHENRLYTVTSLHHAILKSAKTLFLPRSITTDISLEAATKLQYITVSENNPHLYACDGVLYSKDMTTLICYPSRHKKTEYSIPVGVQTISKHAFQNCRIKELHLPYSIIRLDSLWLDNCHMLSHISYERKNQFDDFNESKLKYRRLKKENIVYNLDLYSYTMMAQRGSLQAQVALGDFYLEGSIADTPKDLNQALKWYTLAGEKDFLPAILKLIDIESELHPKEVMKWRMKAAELKHIPSMRILADAYMKGNEINKNPKKGIQLYNEAAMEGDAEAAYQLGIFYTVGVGQFIKPDKTEAFRWLKQAADLNHPNAAFRVGTAYQTGQGVKKDKEQALKYLKKAVFIKE